MALRDSKPGEKVPTSGGASAVSGLPTFWDSADTAFISEWEELWDLFTVAANAKYSISVNEVLREHLRVPALLNTLNEQQQKKIVSVLFLSLGSTARKRLTDKFPHMRVGTVSLREIRKLR